MKTIFQSAKLSKKLVCAGILSAFFVNLAITVLAGSLPLASDAAPENLPKFADEYIEEKWRSNAELLKNLRDESLIWRILRIAKYGLGGLFMMFLGIYTLQFLGSGNKSEAVTEYNKQLIYSFVGFVILALAEPLATALNPLSGETVGAIGTEEGMQRAAGMVGYTYRSAAHVIQYILGGVALIAMGISVMRMVFSAGDEEEIKTQKKTLTWGAVGLLLATGIAVTVDQAFAPIEPLAVGDALAEQRDWLATKDVAQRIIALNYVKYFQTFLGAIAVLMLAIAGYKMVSAGGNEEILTKQRKLITGIFIGLMFVLLAEVFVNIFLPIEEGKVMTPGEIQIESFSAQMGGMVNFLLTFGAGLAVLALVVGGLLLATAAFNQEQIEKGKKVILAACLALLLFVTVYALVHTIFSEMATGEGSGFKLDF